MASRYLLACTAFRRVASDDVVATLTDNGSVYTSRFTGGRNTFEYLLAWLGIRPRRWPDFQYLDPTEPGAAQSLHQSQCGSLDTPAPSLWWPMQTSRA
ncbi:MAG: hypothetical protein AABZ33_10130 [Chloroflexota bacterium]